MTAILGSQPLSQEVLVRDAPFANREGLLQRAARARK